MRFNKKRTGLVLKKCVCMFFLLFIFFNITAQIRTEPKPPKKVSLEEERAREQTRWMYRNLSLEPDQYEKVNEVNLTYAFKADSLDKVRDKALRNDGKAKIKQSKEVQIKTILSPDQYKQYAAHKDKQTAQKKSPFSGTYLGQ